MISTFPHVSYHPSHCLVRNRNSRKRERVLALWSFLGFEGLRIKVKRIAHPVGPNYPFVLFDPHIVQSHTKELLLVKRRQLAQAVETLRPTKKRSSACVSVTTMRSLGWMFLVASFLGTDSCDHHGHNKVRLENETIPFSGEAKPEALQARSLSGNKHTGERCGARSPTPEEAENSKQIVEDWVQNNGGRELAAQTYPIKVWFHVMKAGNTPKLGAWSRALANQAIAKVNYHYQNTPFVFTLAGMTQTTRLKWFQCPDDGYETGKWSTAGNMHRTWGKFLTRNTTRIPVQDDLACGRSRYTQYLHVRSDELARTIWVCLVPRRFDRLPGVRWHQHGQSFFW